MADKLSDYDYDLPPELIASRPQTDRGGSRMLVLHRGSGRIEHRMFRDLPEYLTKEDLLVFNDSKVIPARLHDQSGSIELLLIERRDEQHWVAMVRPGRKMRLGAQLVVGESCVTVKEILPDGTRLIHCEPPLDLERYGEMPIPPYFKRAADAEDRERYQTVFAREPGSVAAPTAGLHFTPEMLAQFSSLFVTLHVGPGTFLPVKTEELSEHEMHSERYEISAEFARRLNERLSKKRCFKLAIADEVPGVPGAQQRSVHNVLDAASTGTTPQCAAKSDFGTPSGRLVAVGTTSVRVLESLPAGELTAHAGETAIFIRPPYQFQRVEALLTNFHFPKSTLLMLISAFAGRELVLEAYREAVRERYRFFSYGDCMLIL